MKKKKLKHFNVTKKKKINKKNVKNPDLNFNKNLKTK